MHHHRSLRAALRTALALLFAVVQLLPLPTGAPARAQAAPLPTAAAQTSAPWLDAQLSGGIIYILYASPAQIQRYDTASQQWLSALTLPGTPTAFRVDGSGILVGLGNTLASFHLDGTGRKDLWTGSYPVEQIVADSQFAFICYINSNEYEDISSINRTTGQAIGTVIDGHVNCPGVSIAPGLRKLFARTKNLGPSDIIQLSYSETGELAYWQDSLYHGDYQVYPDPEKTWVFPNESLVVDESGEVYATDSVLTHKSTLLGKFKDLAFDGSQPLVLRGGTLYAYDDQMVERGSYILAQLPERIFINGNSVFTLRSSTEGPVVAVVPLSMIQPPTPAEPWDAFGLPYTVKDLAFDPDGEIVYLMNQASRNILRWSVAERRYLDPIPLAREPQLITYSAATGKLSIAYNSKEVTQITPAAGLAQTRFAVLGDVPCALESAGELLVLCNDTVRFWGYKYFSIYNPAGSRVSSWQSDGQEWEAAWSSAQSRLYQVVPGNTFTWRNLSTDGQSIDTGSFYDYSNEFRAPIRLSGDQNRLFVGPHSVMDITPPNVVLKGRLPEDVSDGAWFNGTLYTLKAGESGAKLQKWNADLTQAAAQNLPGSPLYLLSTSEGLLAITDYQGRPRFTLWDGALSPLYQPPAADFSVSTTTGALPSLTVQFSNLSLGSEGASYLWDFGDGQTSSEASPEHTYTQLGKFTVSLTVSGSNGADRSIQPDLIKVFARVYLPNVQLVYPTTSYDNACQTFPIMVNDYYYVADMKECVTKMENSGRLRVYFTWTATLITYDCVDKASDLFNDNMYMTDQKGNRYDMLDAGERAEYPIYCMDDGRTYSGWFDFPGPKIAGAVFTFHDDDNHILIGPLAAPK